MIAVQNVTGHYQRHALRQNDQSADLILWIPKT